VIYDSADHLTDNFYGWWGRLEFGAHFLNTLAKSRGGRARVVFHDAVRAGDFEDRKALSRYCEAQVRSAHDVEIARLGIVAPEV